MVIETSLSTPSFQDSFPHNPVSITCCPLAPQQDLKRSMQLQHGPSPGAKSTQDSDTNHSFQAELAFSQSASGLVDGSEKVPQAAEVPPISKSRWRARRWPIAQAAVVIIIAVGMACFAVFSHAIGAPAGPLAIRSLSTYPLARCLDGTPAAYYFGRGSQSHSFVIYLEGEGLCFCDESSSCPSWGSCSLLTGAGATSDGLPTTVFFNNSTLLMPNSMSNSNLVVIPYCSQDLWSGRQLTASNLTFGRFFAGRHILDAVLMDLTTHEHLEKASSVLLTGTGAGGYGVLINLDYVASQLTAATDVVGVPNGGFIYPQAPFFNSSIQWDPGALAEEMVTTFGATASLSAACIKDYPTTPALCFLPPLLARYTASPLFLVQALPDTYQLFALEGVPHEQSAGVLAYMRSLATNKSLTLSSVVQSGTRGVFATSCLTHVVPPGLMVQGISAAGALSCWFDTRQAGCSVADAPWPIQLDCPTS